MSLLEALKVVKRAKAESAAKQYVAFVGAEAMDKKPGKGDAERLLEVLADLGKTGDEFAADVEAARRALQLQAELPALQAQLPGIREEHKAAFADLATGPVSARREALRLAELERQQKAERLDKLLTSIIGKGRELEQLQANPVVAAVLQD